METAESAPQAGPSGDPPATPAAKRCARCDTVGLIVEMTWHPEHEWWVCENHVSAISALCDWSEISALCAKLSGLLDRHDRDRFAYLLRYGTNQ